jgi:putative Mn2+ efflux pump MntP
VPCPHCGKLIRYSKANRIFLIGCWFIFVLICLGLLLEVLYDNIISVIIYWVAWLLFLLLGIPLFTVKLEVSDLEEKDESQEKAR